VNATLCGELVEPAKVTCVGMALAHAPELAAISNTKQAIAKAIFFIADFFPRAVIRIAC
jgi:hypothetical protein